MAPISNLALAAVCAVALCSGCATGPDGVYIDETIWLFVTNRADRAVAEQSQDSATGASVEVGDSSGVVESASSFVADWRYGGFNGSRAAEAPGCRIGSLRVTSTSLSYKWVSGGCETLGAKDRGDYSHTIAAAFYFDEKAGRWVGGKFDWISTSRTSRTFENIVDGYGGWDAVEFFRATRHGFCIVSADGKHRSNFIED